MPEIPINMKVAAAIIKEGYVIGDDESRYLRHDSVTDSPYYTIYRYPLPIPRKLNIFEHYFPSLIPRPEPIWCGTIYFDKLPDNYESRFATGSLWTIITEEPIFVQEMENLASKLTLKFNPTKVYIRRMDI